LQAHITIIEEGSRHNMTLHKVKQGITRLLGSYEDSASRYVHSERVAIGQRIHLAAEPLSLRASDLERSSMKKCGDT